MTLLVALVLVTTALAGCAHAGSDDENETQNSGDPTSPGNGDPFDPDDPVVTYVVQANLTVDDPVGWANDTFRFTGGVDEGDTNGMGQNETRLPVEAVVRYIFDAGEGDPTEVEAPDEPVFEHAYSQGGVYIANLTVVAVGPANDTVEDSVSLLVFVQESHDVAESDLEAGYLVLAEDEEIPLDYEVRMGATFFAVELEITDNAVVGDSAGQITFTDADGEELAKESFEGEGPQTLTGAFTNSTMGGVDHTLTVSLSSGEIQFSGTVTIYYGIDPEEHDLE